MLEKVEIMTVDDIRNHFYTDSENAVTVTRAIMMVLIELTAQLAEINQSLKPDVPTRLGLGK